MCCRCILVALIMTLTFQKSLYELLSKTHIKFECIAKCSFAI